MYEELLQRQDPECFVNPFLSKNKGIANFFQEMVCTQIFINKHVGTWKRKRREELGSYGRCLCVLLFVTGN